MAHKHLIPKGLELFAQGWHPEDIASELGVSRRTVYRWIEQDKKDKSNNSKSKTDNSNNDIKVAPTEKIELDSKLFDDDWVVAANQIAGEHYLIHSHYKNQIRQVYDHCIENHPGDSRKINNISLALERHISGERLAASLDNLDFTRACKTLEKFGFTAVRKDALESE